MYEVRTRMFENTTNNVIGIARFVVDVKFAFKVMEKRLPRR